MNSCISVIIPTYNRLWALKRSVLFFLTQPIVAEIVVIVDGSVDGTAEWICDRARSEPKIRVNVCNHSLGAGGARNLGARMASSPYLFFTDDDMLLAPANGLGILFRELLIRNADIVTSPFICSERGPLSVPKKSACTVVDMVSCHRKLTLELIGSAELARKLPEHSFLSALGTGVMLMKRDVARNVCYDEHLGETSYRDETDFQLKAYTAGYRLYVCPAIWLVDMDRQSDKSGCHRLNRVVYSAHACRNTWRILKRHSETLRLIGVIYPIWIIQVAFIAEHWLIKLPRWVISKSVRGVGLGHILDIRRRHAC